MELRICRNTVIYSVFIHRKANTTGNSKVFQVQVAKNGTIYRIFTVCLCSARQTPLQIAMFWSWPWPKTPLFTVFLNTLSSYLRRRYLRGFYIFAQSRQVYATHKNTVKSMFLPNKNGKNHPPNISEITKTASPTSRQDTSKKDASQNRKSKTKSKKTQFFFTFMLPVPGGRVHELVHSVL